MAVTGPLRRRVEVMEMASIGNAPKINFEACQAVHHLANISLEGVGDHTERSVAVGCAQGLRQPRRASGNVSVRFCTLGALDKFCQKCAGNCGHIAGYNQIPFLPRAGQGRVNAGQRAAAGIYVLDDWITKVTISIPVSDQNYVACSLMYLLRNMFYQRASHEWEQSFVGTHTGALPARQYEARAFHGGNDNIVRICSA